MDEGLTRTKRLMLWLGHYFNYAMIIIMVGAVLSTLLAISTPHQSPRDFGLNFETISKLALLAIFIAGICGLLVFSLLRHDTSLCGRCLADMPLNGQAEATKHLRSLRYFHSRTRLVAAAILLLLFVTAPLYGIWQLPIVLAFATEGTYYALATIRHRRVQPWCPWCHWGRGGDEEFVPEPDPDPAGTVRS